MKSQYQVQMGDISVIDNYLHEHYEKFVKLIETINIIKKNTVDSDLKIEEMENYCKKTGVPLKGQNTKFKEAYFELKKQREEIFIELEKQRAGIFNSFLIMGIHFKSICSDSNHICNYLNLTNDLFDELVKVFNYQKYNNEINDELIETIEKWLVIFFIINSDTHLKNYFDKWTIDQKYDYLNGLLYLEDFSNYSVINGRVSENQKAE